MEINIFNLAWFVFSYYIAYEIGYYIITTGLKRFKIENIPQKKIKIYILAMLIIGLLYDAIIYPLVIPFLMAIHNKVLLIFVGAIESSLITFIITFLLFKYYFLLSGKKLEQLSLYIASITLITLLIINGLLLGV
jgi:hypothetical protein